MKRTHFAAAAIAMASMVPGFAQKQSVPPPSPYTAAPDVQAFNSKAVEVRELMQKMQEQMARMDQARDLAERRILMQEHWETMQAAMTGMRGLSRLGLTGACRTEGPGMLGPGMPGYGGMHRYCSNPSPDQRYMADQYIGMQHVMLDHMLQHQRWMLRLPHATASSN